MCSSQHLNLDPIGAFERDGSSLKALTSGTHLELPLIRTSTKRIALHGMVDHP